jgi:hypothetical protein
VGGSGMIRNLRREMAWPPSGKLITPFAVLPHDLETSQVRRPWRGNGLLSHWIIITNIKFY